MSSSYINLSLYSLVTLPFSLFSKPFLASAFKKEEEFSLYTGIWNLLLGRTISIKDENL